MMFEPIEAASGLPYRRRSAALADTRYDEFTCRDFTLFVLPTARDQIQGSVRKAAPNETMGLLSGRSFFDEEGEYTIVGGATVAPRLTAHGSRVHVDPRQRSELREEAARHHPYLDVVGWFHSHSYDSPYSEVDRSEQKHWEQRHNVGILAFMRGKIWARAYHGPDSTLLEQVPPQTARALEQVGSADAAAAAGVAGSAGVTPPALTATAPGFATATPAVPATLAGGDDIHDLTRPAADPGEGPPNPQVRSMRVLVAVIVSLLVAAVVTSVAALVVRPGDDRDDDRSPTATNPTPAGPTIDPTEWSCAPSDPGKHVCVLDDDVSARPLWVLDGADYPGGKIVVFEDLRPGRHVVGLDLARGRDVVHAGTQVIDVAGEDEPETEGQPDGETQPDGVGGGREGS